VGSTGEGHERGCREGVRPSSVVYRPGRRSARKKNASFNAGNLDYDFVAATDPATPNGIVQGQTPFRYGDFAALFRPN
jgi:hypothetical protein